MLESTQGALKTVFHAQAMCREYGAHLATIPNREVEIAVANHISKMVSSIL
jgi:hypothetical protein